MSRDKMIEDALTGFLDLLDRHDNDSRGWVPHVKPAEPLEV